jgi:hypothetical protein
MSDESIRKDISKPADDIGKPISEAEAPTPTRKSTCAHCNQPIENADGLWVSPVKNGSTAYCDSSMSLHKEVGAAEAPTPTQPLNIPFQRKLTVVMMPDDSRQQADKDVDTDAATTVRIGVSENYFHQLRLRVAQKPEIEKDIVVFNIAKSGVIREVGMKFEDELKWPVGFMNEAWDIESEIQKARGGKFPEVGAAEAPTPQLIYSGGCALHPKFDGPCSSCREVRKEEEAEAPTPTQPMSDAELTADDNWCPTCGDPREACICTKSSDGLRVAALVSAIQIFRMNAGRHEGDHDFSDGANCSKCVESYNHYETTLDEALSAVADGELLCPIHRELDANGHLAPFSNCVACIRNERDELRARLAASPSDEQIEKEAANWWRKHQDDFVAEIRGAGMDTHSLYDTKAAAIAFYKHMSKVGEE